MRWKPTIADISSAHGFILLLFYYDSDYFSSAGMQKRNGEKKGIKRTVFMSLGEKVSNFITHLHNSAIFGDFVYALKKKVRRAEKVLCEKVDSRRIHGRRSVFREHKLFVLVVDTISCLLWFTVGAHHQFHQSIAFAAYQTSDARLELIGHYCYYILINSCIRC